MGLCLCTHFFEDDDEISQSQSFQRNVKILRTRIQARNLPIIWIRGPNEALHAASISDRFGFALIDLKQLTAHESEVASSRGRLVKHKLLSGQKIPDRIVVNLVKERMLKTGDTYGYIFLGFPQNTKQATFFAREIAMVDCVIMLRNIQRGGNSPQLEGDRARERENAWKIIEEEEEKLRDLVRNAGGKWDMVVERINSNEPPSDIFLRIEAVILDLTSTLRI